MTIRQILQNKKPPRGITPLEAELILSHIIKKPREFLFAHPEYKLSKSHFPHFKSHVMRRLRGEPIAYITGKKEFFGLNFEVNKNVLIPRPETELLVEKALDLLFKVRPFRLAKGSTLGVPKVEPSAIIDIGTGSGNIIISIAKNIPDKIKKGIDFYALDISKKALGIAKKNAKINKVEKFIKFFQSDLLCCFLKKNRLSAKNLIIAANLPYLSPELYQKNRNNLKYEPKIALLSQKNGLNHYERLFRQLRDICKLYGFLQVFCYVEISPEQKTALIRLQKKHFPNAKLKFQKDLAGKNRVAEFAIHPPAWKRCLASTYSAINLSRISNSNTQE